MEPLALLLDFRTNHISHLSDTYLTHVLHAHPQADEKLALLQHGTRLYLVNMAAVSRDLFYQLLLTRWEGVSLLALAHPLHVGTLMDLALQQEEAAGRWKVCCGGCGLWDGNGREGKGTLRSFGSAPRC